MKRTVIIALALTSALLMSGCKKDESSSTKKTRETNEQTTEEKTEETSEETEAETSDTTATHQPIVLGEDPMDYFKDTNYQIPVNFIGFLDAGTSSWDTSLVINNKKRSFRVLYESFMPTLDFSGYDVQRGEGNGLITGFVRENDYSFKTKIQEIDFKKFDDTTETYLEKPANVKFCEPYGFEKPDELILYLPNTPMEQFPEEARSWVERFISDADSKYLGLYVIYNPNEKTAFIIDHYSFADTEKQTKENMEYWSGKHVAPEGTVEIVFDDQLGEYVANVHMSGANEYDHMRIRQFKGDTSSLLLYGSSKEGTTVLLSLAGTEESSCLAVYESDDPGFTENTHIYSSKQK